MQALPQFATMDSCFWPIGCPFPLPAEEADPCGHGMSEGAEEAEVQGDGRLLAWGDSEQTDPPPSLLLSHIQGSPELFFFCASGPG